MTDRELLERAAKAAGWTAGFITAAAAPDVVLTCIVDTGEKIFMPWNPLEDDGDALRLAVKLNLFNRLEHTALTAEFTYDVGPYEVMRRAIVLAAAEMAKESS